MSAVSRHRTECGRLAHQPPAPERRRDSEPEPAPDERAPELIAGAARDPAAMAAMLAHGDAGAREEAVGGLQRALGHARVARMPHPPKTGLDHVDGTLSGEGRPLEPAVRSSMEAAFGGSLADVRVHTDAEAGESARRLDADAYSLGTDIVFAPGRYDPVSAKGRHMIAHEVAHLVQQGMRPAEELGNVPVAPARDGHEREADRAAMRAVLGGRAAVGSAAPAIRRFKQEGVGGHAPMTENALEGMGMSPEGAHAGRLGNWERDLSQALTPGVVALLDSEKLFAVLNIMAIQEFGRGLNAAEFGTYDPVEHMDNPTDLRGSDVFLQGAGTANPDFAGGPLAPAGGESTGYATVDPRYGTAAAGMDRKSVMNPGDAPAFWVDASGIPVYMSASKDWLKQMMRQAARSGRTGDGWRRRNETGEEVGEVFGAGPRDFSSGIHVMQDYYAHSNYCEIALNILIREGGVKVRDPAGELAELSASDSLSTMVHPNDPATGDPRRDVNLTVRGPGGRPREAMTTGSFNLTDTAASILEELKEKLIALNPFEKKEGPSDLVNAILDYIDMTGPTDFSATGQTLADLVRPVSRTLKTMGEVGGSIVEGAGEVGGGAVRAGGDVAGFGMRALDFLGAGRINEALGGDSDYFDWAAGRVEAGAGAAASSVEGATSAAAKAVRDACGWLDTFADDLSNDQHLLKRLYAWWSGIDFLAPLKALVGLISEDAVKEIEALQKALREKAEEILAGAWRETVTKAVEGLDRVIQLLRLETNIEDKKRAGKEEFDLSNPSTWDDAIARKLGAVGDLYDESGRPTAGIAPESYTPPSHTEIAKDHPDIGAALEGIEEREEENGGHAHTHSSAWLNPLAHPSPSAPRARSAGRSRRCGTSSTRAALPLRASSPRSTARPTGGSRIPRTAGSSGTRRSAPCSATRSSARRSSST